MAYNFLPAQRDQLYLMPPSVSDWLAEDLKGARSG